MSKVDGVMDGVMNYVRQICLANDVQVRLLRCGDEAHERYPLRQYDLDRFGVMYRHSPVSPTEVMIVTGTLTKKMALALHN